LIQACPELAPFIRPAPTGRDTIDFADPAAVIALNRALLRHRYGVAQWDIPPGYLCPPIPGRADYIHHVADLLAQGGPAAIPRGPAVVVLDIGTGANCIYPILGVREYGWRFVGTEIDPTALAWARKLIAANPNLAGQIELRQQRSPSRIFLGIAKPGERFAACMCNPPFHASAAEAAAGTLRKVRNLAGRPVAQPVLNFGGRRTELWCAGGEAGFVRRMIAESAQRPDLCRWFTTSAPSTSPKARKRAGSSRGAFAESAQHHDRWAERGKGGSTHPALATDERRRRSPTRVEPRAAIFLAIYYNCSFYYYITS
jgi:23S rRNA (adenine1618-N6)-methyltransferase